MIFADEVDVPCIEINDVTKEYYRLNDQDGNEAKITTENLIEYYGVEEEIECSENGCEYAFKKSGVEYEVKDKGKGREIHIQM